MKRIFDFLLAVFGLIISSPLGVIFSLLIWFEDGCPVFYISQRVGKNGVLFKCLKFRSMSLDVDRKFALLQKRSSDSRVTKIGKLLRMTAAITFRARWETEKNKFDSFASVFKSKVESEIYPK